MELSTQLEERGIRLKVGWLPREANQPADDLTNRRFDRFDQARRRQVSWEAMVFRYLPSLVREGREYLAELKAARLERSSRGVAHGRKRKGDSLRERNPW